MKVLEFKKNGRKPCGKPPVAQGRVFKINWANVLFSEKLSDSTSRIWFEQDFYIDIQTPYQNINYPGRS